MVQLNVSGDYVTLVVNGSTQEEVSKTSDSIEYNKYSDGKVSLTIGRRSFEMVDPTDFEIDGVAVTDAADFVTKLTAVFGSGGASYLVYTALLNQVGTDAPVATVLENTIGNIVWTRLDVGEYLGTLTGAFTENKTFITCNTSGTIGAIITVSGWVNTDVVKVFNYTDAAFTLSDGVEAFIEIRVYP